MVRLAFSNRDWCALTAFACYSWITADWLRDRYAFKLVAERFLEPFVDGALQSFNLLARSVYDEFSEVTPLSYIYPTFVFFFCTLFKPQLFLATPLMLN